ncbi:hypothetical protein K456DRAFT_58329, partial [Colletotrichum gloeosporioides 23]
YDLSLAHGQTSIALQQSTCDYHHRYFQLTFTANYLLSLRLITLASEDLIYYSLRPTTTTPVYCFNVNPQLLLADPTVG